MGGDSVDGLLEAKFKADAGRRHFLKGVAGLSALTALGPAFLAPCSATSTPSAGASSAASGAPGGGASWKLA